MSIQELIIKHPDLYLSVLNMGGHYMSHGYSDFKTIEDVAAANEAIDAEYGAMMQEPLSE